MDTSIFQALLAILFMPSVTGSTSRRPPSQGFSITHGKTAHATALSSGIQYEHQSEAASQQRDSYSSRNNRSVEINKRTDAKKPPRGCIIINQYKPYLGTRMECGGEQFQNCSHKFFLPESAKKMNLSSKDFSSFKILVANTQKVNVSALHITNMALKSVTDLLEIFRAQNITSLYLKNNHISQLEDGLFRNAMNLVHLDLSYNRITRISVTALAGAKKLIYLYLQNNQLDNELLDTGLLQKNVALKELDLRRNKITRLPRRAFKNLTKLTRLKLSENNLGSTLLETPGVFLDAENLQDLQLRKCNISSVDKSVFSGLQNLETLDLTDNVIAAITGQAFQELLSLKLLKIKGNLLHEINRQWGLPSSLMSLRLQGNMITTIEEGALEYLPLKGISLDNNNLTTLPIRVQMYFATAQIIMGMADNPWTCDCDLFYMIAHIHQNGARYAGIMCNLPTEIRMADVNPRSLKCPSSVPEYHGPPCDRPLEVQTRPGKQHCWCIPGTEPISTMGSDKGCTYCQPTFYRPRPTNTTCRPCSDGSVRHDGPSPLCSCAKGYFTNADGDCEKCPEGTFKSFVGAGSCAPCISLSQNAACNISEIPSASTISHLSAPLGLDSIQTSVVIMIACIVGVTIVTLILLLLVYFNRQHRANSRATAMQRLPRVTCLRKNSHYSPSEEYQFSSSCSVDFRSSGSGRHILRIKEVGAMIGRGAFGQVYECTVILSSFTKDGTKAALKKLKETANDEERKVLKDELEQMMNVGKHPNIIDLLGPAVYQGQQCIVMEYAHLGDLLTYLKNEYTSPLQYVSVDRNGLVRETGIPKMEDNEKLIMFAWQISKGMRHLELHRFIHRDLAARNCLLTHGPVAKVSDFGLSKDAYELGHYKRVQKDRVPFKWLSPEALLWGQYSSKSDVWAFGVLLYELYTFGGTPYPQVTTDQLREMHEKGYRMGRPPDCPEPMYRLMRTCWRQSPRQRPSFKLLETKLENMLLKTSGKKYVDIQPAKTNPVPLMEEDLDDTRTSLQIVSRSAPLRHNSEHCITSLPSAIRRHLSASSAYLHYESMSSEKFPMLAMGESVSDDSTVTSGFQSMTST